MAKVTFASKVGLIAATVGSAVGLGNIWRFPAETQTNGGAAFLFIYIICLLLFGIPCMLAEFSLGRGGKGDAVSAFKNIKPNTKWWIAGALAVLVSYLILCFYMVVAGWTLEYLWQSITGDLYQSTAGEGLNQSFHEKMEEYICSDWGPLINTFVMIIINLAILIAGVQKGIERMSNILMPVLFILLLVFCGVSLSLPGSMEGVKFFLSPDFSKITPTVITSALGQAFTVSLLDLMAAVMMGMIIFPAVSSFGLQDAELRGTTLVFVTLPEIFAQMPGTQLWSILFFLLLIVAALTSTISIAEVAVAWLQDHFKKSRLQACLIVLLPLFLFSSLCSLSFGSLSWIKIAGMNIFDSLDTLSTNILLPVVSILTCIFMGWIVRSSFFKNEITNNGKIEGRFYPVVRFAIKYMAPPLILIILIATFV